MDVILGWTLVAGFATFLVGAARWKLAYQQPLEESLPVIAGDRRRRAWIHSWMLPGVVVTAAGTAGVPLIVSTDETAVALAVMAAVVYGLGAACMIASLLFRLTVVPWAADRTVETGRIPEHFSALDAWAGSMYVLHMALAYLSFGLLGLAILADGVLATWVGWAGVVIGFGSLAGFGATRAAGPFNPPILAHLYTLILGIAILTA